MSCEVVAETAQSAYEAGCQMHVRLMIGSNSADFVGFISADSKDALFSQFGERKAEAIAAYDASGTTALAELLVMAGTDRVQAEPARFVPSAFVAKVRQQRLSLILHSRCVAGAMAKWCSARCRNLLCVWHSRCPIRRNLDFGGSSCRSRGQYLLVQLREDWRS